MITTYWELFSFIYTQFFLPTYRSFLDQDTLLVYCNIAGYFLVTFRRSGKSDLVLSLAGLHKAHSTTKTVSDTFSTDISGWKLICAVCSVRLSMQCAIALISVDVLLCCIVAILLCCSAALLLCCCAAVLLCFLCYFLTVLLCCCVSCVAI